MEERIKKALFAWLERRYKNKVITTEVALKTDTATNIVDMLMATKSLYAFEIKGPKDNLKRLPAQIDTYTKLFDFVYVVYWRGKFQIDDERVGLIEAYEKNGRICFKRIKKARKNSIDHTLVVKNLFKGEMLYFLKGSCAKNNKMELSTSLLEQKEPNEIIKIYKTVMRYRYRWGYIHYKIYGDWNVFKKEKIKAYLNIA